MSESELYSADFSDNVTPNQAVEMNRRLDEIRAEVSAREQCKSALNCKECGKRILKARREALQGVQTCITCAQNNSSM